MQAHPQESVAHVAAAFPQKLPRYRWRTAGRLSSAEVKALKSSTGAENSAGRVLSSSVLCLSHRGANACRPCGGGGSAVCHFGSRFLCGDRTRLGKLAAPVASFPTEVDSSELWVLQVKKSAAKAVHRSLRGSQGSRGVTVTADIPPELSPSIFTMPCETEQTVPPTSLRPGRTSFFFFLSCCP